MRKKDDLINKELKDDIIHKLSMTSLDRKERRKLPFAKFRKEVATDMIIKKGSKCEKMSVMKQLSWLFSQCFKVDNLHDGDEKDTGSKQNYFHSKMKQYDTFYISDVFHKKAPTPKTVSDEGDGEQSRRIVCAAILEVVSFTHRQYEYKKSRNNKNEVVYDRNVVGYRTTSKAIILHNIATIFYFRNFGYARCLLRGLSNEFKDKGVYIYCTIPPEEEGVYPTKSYSAKQFLQSMGFVTDPKKENFNLSIVDEKRNTDHPFTDARNEVFRCSTTHIGTFNLEPTMYQSAQYLQVDRSIMKQIIFTKKIEEEEQIDDFLNNYNRTNSLYVKRGIRGNFTIPSMEGTRKRKGEQHSSHENKVDEDDNSDNKKRHVERKAVSNLTSEEDADDDFKLDTKHYILYGFNPHFGWRSVEDSEVPPSLLKRTKDHPDKILRIPAGNRSKQKFVYSSLETQYHLPLIKRAFHVSSRSDVTYGSCQWLATAMLIDLENQQEARTMMKYLHNFPDTVNWKFMYYGTDPLAEVLPRITKYAVCKVKTGTISKKDFLLQTREGKFVAVLKDNNYSESHVVGIDCDSSPKMIWDCAERSALTLSQENLNRCTGENTICIGIKTLGEIKLKQKA